MIPLKDDNPTRSTPYLTVGLIAMNILVFFYQISAGPHAEEIVAAYGAIPSELLHGGRMITVFTSMFLHGGFLHIAGNMLYLWIFGNNIEDALGHIRFLVFYLLCGVAAAYSHALTSPSATVPMVGASGAISGVLGAYLILYPRARVLTLIPLFPFGYQIVRIPALIVLGFWILLQFFYGMITVGHQGGGVAWFAHIGGFVAGILFLGVFRRRRRWRGTLS